MEDNKEKKLGAKEIVRRIILVVLIIVFLISAGHIVDYFLKMHRNNKRNNLYQDIFYDPNAVTDTDSKERGKPISWDSLFLQNQDLVGWLKVDGTKTDNPVVKGQNDTADSYEYLYKAFDGYKSQYGTLFTHYQNTFDNKLNDNTIIYGHHMNDGSMMGGLKNLRKEEFIKQHNTLEFTPIYEKYTDTWKIFAVILADTPDSPNLPPEGSYNYMVTDFKSDYEFMEFVDEAYQRSIIKTPAQDVVPTDKILTLSTCIYDFTGARLLIMARQVRDGEELTMNPDEIMYNPSTVYPPAYYAKKGGTPRTVTEYTFETYIEQYGKSSTVR